MGEGFLFVYGTLRSGHVPAAIAPALEGARSLGLARVAGRLYDLGAYPGARLDGGPGDEIEGEVLAIPDLATRLPLLDRYECCDPVDPDAGLYRRTSCDARLANGSSLRCEVYEIVRLPPDAAPIAAGRWPPSP